MAAAEVAPVRPGFAPDGRRLVWAGATVTLTLCPLVLAVILAPSDGAPPTRALTALLFIGSSVHVASTAWFVTVPEVRRHMRAHPQRYLWAPLALVLTGAITAVAAPGHLLAGTLLGFFAWQFLHFQKQNLGLAALAARGFGAAPLSPWERRAIVGAGAGGSLALIGHPQLLQLAHLPDLPFLFAAGAATFSAAVAAGFASLARRPSAARPAVFVVLFAQSLVFFAPVLLFDSPYAAVAGLTVAHGLQYLLLMGLVAGAPTVRRTPGTNLLVLLNIGLAGGVLLNWWSHLHSGGPAARAVFGVYLGLSAAHFVVDGGLWRLRHEFPRAFLAERMPWLLAHGESAV